MPGKIIYAATQGEVMVRSGCSEWIMGFEASEPIGLDATRPQDGDKRQKKEN